MPRFGNNSAPQKAKNTKQSIVKLLRYIKSFAPMLIIAIVLVIGATICRLVGPNQLGKITDMITQAIPQIKDNIIISPGIEINLAEIMDIAFLLIGLFIFSFVATYIANVLIGTVCFKMSKKLRQDISVKINKLPLKYLDRKPYGDVLSTITNDVDMLGQTLQQSASSLVGAIILFSGSLIMMFVTNWIMALSAIASTVIGFAIMILIISKSQKYFIEQQESLGEVDGVVEEIYSGQNIVKTYNATGEVTESSKK